MNVIRNLLFQGAVVLALAAGAQAQKSISVSKTTKAGTDIVTIRYKDSGENQTKELTANVDLAKGTSADDKAAKVKAAINAVKNSSVSASIDATKSNKVNVTGATGVKILSANLSGSSGEARDAMADIGDDECLFTTTLLGDLEYADADGNPSTFTIGTARGEVEVTLVDSVSLEQAMSSALVQLRDIGIDAWMPDATTIAFLVDPELDQEAIFGCTDAGVVQVSDLSTIDEG